MESKPLRYREGDLGEDTEGGYYEPELGQAIFGQPTQELECPEYMQDALEALRWLLIFLRDEDANDPFANTGAYFECDVFKVFAYLWDQGLKQEFNFEWRDVRVSWYKWLGRGMSINRLVTWDRVQQMLRECISVLFGVLGEQNEKNL